MSSTSSKGPWRYLSMVVGALAGLLGGAAAGLLLSTGAALTGSEMLLWVTGVASMFVMILGAILGALAARRNRLGSTVAASLLLMVVAMAVATAFVSRSDATTHSGVEFVDPRPGHPAPGIPPMTGGVERTPAHPSSAAADECRNQLREASPGRASTVVVFSRACPGGGRTIDVSVLTTEGDAFPTGPGNALVLDGSRDSVRNPLFVISQEAPDSSITLTYDSRARVLSQQSPVGAIRVRVIADTMTRAGRAQSPTVTPLPPLAPPTPCHIESRLADPMPPALVLVFKRICPGKPPTLEASVTGHGMVVIGAEQGNALVVDASADTPEHPLAIRVIKPTPTDIVFDVDSRARIIFIGPMVGGIRIGATGGRHDR